MNLIHIDGSRDPMVILTDNVGSVERYTDGSVKVVAKRKKLGRLIRFNEQPKVAVYAYHPYVWSGPDGLITGTVASTGEPMTIHTAPEYLKAAKRQGVRIIYKSAKDGGYSESVGDEIT